MKNTTKFGIFLGLFVMGVLTFGAFNLPAEQQKDINLVENLAVQQAPPEKGANIKYDGYVTIYKVEALTGQKILVENSKHNLLTNIGKNFIKAKLNGSDVTATNNLSSVSLSADAGGGIAATDTQLNTEINANGLARNGSVWSVNGTNGFNITAVWTATNSQSAASTGLQWTNAAASNNNLFAELPFSSQSLLVNDQLQVIWQITLS